MIDWCNTLYPTVITLPPILFITACPVAYVPLAWTLAAMFVNVDSIHADRHCKKHCPKYYVWSWNGVCLIGLKWRKYRKQTFQKISQIQYTQNFTLNLKMVSKTHQTHSKRTLNALLVQKINKNTLFLSYIRKILCWIRKSSPNQLKST